MNDRRHTVPAPIGDHFDGLADALRDADKQGINSGVVMVSAIQQLVGHENLSSRDVVDTVTLVALGMIDDKRVMEQSERIAREYMSKFEAYIGTLPQAVQNDMRRELEATLRETLQK